MHFYLIISLILFSLGNILILLGFQIPVPKDEVPPEWIFDMISIGTALFFASPFTMIVGLCKKYRNWHLSMCRIPASLGCFFTLFNMCKEVTGLNKDYSTTQLVVFIIGMTLTLTIQYEFHRKHIG